MHACVLVIALTLSGYASITKDLTASAKLRLGAVNAEGLTSSQGGTVDQVQLGRLGTIIKPLEVPAGPPVLHTPISYTVADGDNLGSIAGHFGVTEDDIRWSNAELTNTDRVKTGEQLTIPPIHGLVYTVQMGDTVQGLANKFRVDSVSVVNFNYLRHDSVDAGVRLIIPGGVGPQLFPRRVSSDPPHLGNFANAKFYYGYCTWYVASRTDVPWTGDAWAWYGGAQAMGYDTGQVPQPGAIMVTWESWVGHVAYVESVNADGSFVVSEMNYKGWGIIDTRLLHTKDVPMIGFIYPKS
ncbi:MAG: LysM peptidoglycan-binding domain-containing protein [Chloroflexi bacterium]|nr:MAG: LysM peptidoglycan-binding domain-containing protein [Chloroflexota bacterium]